jgi:radical SAM protein with 4Fe4S-binding SPASM domain
MIRNEEMPEANNIRSRCRDCEYLNFCNDIW